MSKLNEVRKIIREVLEELVIQEDCIMELIDDEEEASSEGDEQVEEAVLEPWEKLEVEK